MRTRITPRRGFTLVEMMVVVALTMFIMVILSTAFGTALETFRQLKALGDMQDQLRTASNMLRSDLTADHFEGKRRLSDTVFWTLGPPREGFVRLTQGVTPANDPLDEGKDADGLPSRRRVDHVIQCTLKRRGNRLAEFFSAPVADPNSPLLNAALFPLPDGRFQDPGVLIFNSQWAEAIWFLAPALTANGTQATANGVPLWGLYRQQRVVIPDPTLLNTPGNQLDVSKLTPAVLLSYLNQFSCSVIPDPAPNSTKQFLYFNSPSALTVPERRLQPDPTAKAFLPRKDASGNYTGDDLVMTNVVSFDVQVVRSDNPGLVSDLSIPAGATVPYFDTWSFLQDDLGANYADPSTIPQLYRLTALQITLRVWDSRTQQTRQITLFQEM